MENLPKVSLVPGGPATFTDAGSGLALHPGQPAGRPTKWSERLALEVKIGNLRVLGSMPDIIRIAKEEIPSLPSEPEESIDEDVELDGADSEVDESKSEDKRQCQALTKAGKRCARLAVTGSDYCSAHKNYIP